MAKYAQADPNPHIGDDHTRLYDFLEALLRPVFEIFQKIGVTEGAQNPVMEAYDLVS